MKFKRWGSLAPQKHTLDETKFHCAPVKNGIYAFPVEYADTDYIFGYTCIRNGRYRYVKDKDGKKVMMTQKELDDVKTKMTESYHSIVASPDFLRGMDYDSLFLKTEYIYDLDKPEKEDDDVMGGDEGIITIDPDKRYPLMTKINKPRTFCYDGTIWHHLETTDSFEYWMINSPGGLVYSKEFDRLRRKNCIEKMGKEQCEKWIEEEHARLRTMKFKRLVRPEDVIRRSGSWILTDIRVYEQALNKATHIEKFNRFMKQKRDPQEYGMNNIVLVDGRWVERNWIVEGRHTGIPNHKCNLGLYEVFIEKVK